MIIVKVSVAIIPEPRYTWTNKAKYVVNCGMRNPDELTQKGTSTLLENILDSQVEMGL